MQAGVVYAQCDLVGPFDLTACLALRTHSRYSAMKDTSNIVPISGHYDLRGSFGSEPV